MRLNSVTIASMILAILMASAVLLINDPAPSSYPHMEIAERIISQGADFCRSCP